MQKKTAAAGSSIFFALAPGTVAGVVPWLVTRWRFESFWLPLRFVGAVLLLAAVPILVHAFVRFVREGAGTPAPIAPTVRLVIGGPYRYVRNPMYVAVSSAIVGQALLFGSVALFAYAGVVALAFVLFVRFYEEPVLRQRFGAEYEAYRKAVPAWRPRMRAWYPEREESSRR